MTHSNHKTCDKFRRTIFGGEVMDVILGQYSFKLCLALGHMACNGILGCGHHKCSLEFLPDSRRLLPPPHHGCTLYF